LAGRGQLDSAADSSRRALTLASSGWRQRGRAVEALVSTLAVARNSHACATTAASEAPRLPRERTFASVVAAGLACANQGGETSWAEAARQVLEPLAVSALRVAGALRDDRFQLYQQLMVAADRRHDEEGLARLGDAWLAEIDGVV